MTEIKAKIDDSGNITVLIPLDEYELANLIGVMKRATNNGDWHHQILWKLRQSLVLLGIDATQNNFGDTVTPENIVENYGT